MTTPPPPASDDHAEAVTPGRFRISVAWLFPLLAAAAAGWLFWSNWTSHGPEITIRFATAPGLQAGKSVLIYRGVTAGEITGVHLDSDLGAVQVRVRLKAFAAGLARKNTVFWIDQPEISITQLTGLESIIQGNSLQARAGDGPTETRFVGLDDAPIEPVDSPSLVLRLRPTEMPRIIRGAPVYHRGIVVGAVSALRLDERGQPELRVVVDAGHAGLVRSSTRFWRLPAASLTAGAGGIKLDVPGLAALLEGGLAFDDFGSPGEAVPDGSEFPLFGSLAVARASSPPVRITFDDGTGLVAGETALRHRGMPIGLVEAVTLDATAGRVEIVARFEPGFERFATEGAAFSVVRANISIDGVTGLNTLLNGVYIECSPGRGGEPLAAFVGAPTGAMPPLPGENGGLELLLTADAIPAAGVGTPVLRRGVVVGRVREKGFDAEGRPFLRIVISRAFAAAVPANARFWRVAATSMDLGPGGVQFSVEGLATLLQGGIAFDAFEPVTASASSGAIFPLFATEAAARCTSEPIRITFENGQGLVAGRTQLRVRGVPVGLVESVTPGPNAVVVVARFEPGHEKLARTSTLFALVRPQVSVEGVSGLETLVSGVYIDCVPGSGGAPSRDFTAQTFAAAEAETQEIDAAAEGRLEIVLTTDATSISPGAPVLYRGVNAGSVVRKALSADAGKVDLFVEIDRAYAPLIRENTRFWNAGGLKASLGLFWVKVDSTPLPTLTLGGIAFATPPDDAAPVRNGHRFPLYASPRREWLRWTPASPAPR